MRNTEKKLFRQYIISERNSGKTDKEIYEYLKTKHTDKKAVAKLIAGTASREAIEKHKWIAHLLAFTLLIGCVFYAYMAWMVYNPSLTQTCDFWFRMALFSVFTIGFIYLIYQFRIEEVPMFFAAFFWVFFYSRLVRSYSPHDSMASTGILIAILIFGYFYHKKMFPKWGISGIKKDKDGEYIL